MKELLDAHKEWMEDYGGTFSMGIYAGVGVCSQCGCECTGECAHMPLDQVCGLDVSGKCYCCERFNQLKKDRHGMD